MAHLHCSSCGEVVLKSIDGMVKIRNKVMIFKGGLGYAVCKGCGREHLLPIKLDRLELIKSLEHTPLFVKDLKPGS